MADLSVCFASMDVERHAGINYYPFQCLCFDLNEIKLIQYAIYTRITDALQLCFGCEVL